MNDDKNGAGSRPDRRRGVRASPAKLNQALAASDLSKKTQAALADRIAEIEGLDAGPKDLVSRVFRGVPIDAQSLERVARALRVPSDSLYENGGDAASVTPETAPPHATAQVSFSSQIMARLRSFDRRVMVTAAIGLAVVVMAGVTFSQPEPRCTLSRAVNPAAVRDGRIGILVARFDNDPGDRAQAAIIEGLADNKSVQASADLVRGCKAYDPPESGNVTQSLEALRTAAQRELQNADAHVLIWGEVRNGQAHARLISTRRSSSAASELGDRIVQLDEMQITSPITLSAPAAGLKDLQRLAIEFSAPQNREAAEKRAEILAQMDTSIDWLDASIIADRNYLRSLGEVHRGSQWDLVNAQLCYKYRLRGEARMEKSDFLEADFHCRNALSRLSKENSASDWAAVSINRASIPPRLSLFSQDPAERRKLLAESEAIIGEILNSDQDRIEPLQLATAKRILAGILALKLEIAEGEEAEKLFADAKRLTDEALTLIDKESAPLAFAHLHQNVCVGHFRRAMRVGGAPGVSDTDEAMRRCALAREAVSFREAPLEWAMVQNNLAIATAINATLRNEPEALAAAIEEFQAAQLGFRSDVYPAKWAEVEVNLGELNCNLARLKRDKTPIDAGLQHAEASLEQFIRFGVDAYAGYARKVISNLQACRADITTCKCSS
jgi:hypothetical protein